MFNDNLEPINYAKAGLAGLVWLLLQYPLYRQSPEIYDTVSPITLLCGLVYFTLTDWIWSVEAFTSGLHPYGRRWLLLAHCDRFGVEPCDVTVFYNTAYQTAYSTMYSDEGEHTLVTGVTYARVSPKPKMTAIARGMGNTSRMCFFTRSTSPYSADVSHDPPPPPPVYITENPTDITEALTWSSHTGIRAEDQNGFVYATIKYIPD